MGISITHTPPAVVLSLTSGWEAKDVHAALAGTGTSRHDALVFDFTSSRSVADLERALIEWGVEFLAFVVRDERMAEVIARHERVARAKVRVCESVPEALRWIEKVREGAAPPVRPAPVEAARADEPVRPFVPWPTRLCSLEILGAAAAVLRAIEAETTSKDRAATVEPPGKKEHLDAFERAAGLLPADVRNVYTLMTGFSCEAYRLNLDFTRYPPHTLEFGSEQFLIVNGESEGLALQIDPEICRLWHMEHDGPSLTLVERGVDAWLVRCATLALRHRDYDQEVRAALAMGTALPTSSLGDARRAAHRLDSRPVADVRRGEPAHSPAHAWLASLPDSARIFDFRRAAPGTEVNGLWEDGEWTCHGELWAVT